MNSGGWSAWASLGSTATVYPSSPQTPTAQGMGPATYDFKVRGCNSSGCGPESNVRRITVTATGGCASGTDAGGNPLTLVSGTYTTIGNGQKYHVNKFGGDYCFGNSGGTTYFVPLNSWAEFNSFWNAIPRLSSLYAIP